MSRNFLCQSWGCAGTAATGIWEFGEQKPPVSKVGDVLILSITGNWESRNLLCQIWGFAGTQHHKDLGTGRAESFCVKIGDVQVLSTTGVWELGGQEPTVSMLGIWMWAGVEFHRVSGAL